MKKIIPLLSFLFLGIIATAQTVNIPDANFKTALLNYPGIDTNTDGEVQISEALGITNLSLSGFGFNGGQPNISNQTASLMGLEAFTNLTSLYLDNTAITSFNFPSLTNLLSLELRSNTQLASVNLVPLTNLIYFTSSQSNLSSLNLSTLNSLERLNCEFNSLTSLDVSNLTQLEMLSCSYNQIAQLDLSNLTQLYFLGTDHNNLTTLDLTNNHMLQYLYCSYNQLTDLVNIDAPSLHTIECAYNQLTSLDFSHTRTFLPFGGTSGIYTYGNPGLNFINLKTGYQFTDGYINTDHPIQYICTDDYNIAFLANLLQSPLFSGTNIGTYCDFVPGGNHNTISGNFNYDADGNGCTFQSTKTATTIDFPFQNVMVSLSGASFNATYSNPDGQYSLFAPAGNFTITPSTIPYFTISPTSATVSFANTNDNAHTQNFCISPNGVHNDLEITILNLQNARPGFDVSYKLIYKNKGTSTMSGSINLAFDDAILDFVSANPGLNNQSLNTLTWNFASLNPFETRTIDLTLNLNGPMEIPAVNLDDVLHYVATINPIAGDETPEDNTSELNQIVRGSLDPNDKTCLEGTTISTAQVGDYLNYVIRFQNTGTDYAENVVIKDMIDTNKFDIASLRPISSSHTMETRVTGNKVEFVFEGINLPATVVNEPASHGYVVFKIKTKSNLVLGNTVSNTASIYFDYNFPVVTNTASTTITALGVGEYENNSVIIYPNPTRNTVSISAKDVVRSVQLFDIQGRLISTELNNTTEASLDLSQQMTGVYFVKVYTSEGMKVQKIIKE